MTNALCISGPTIKYEKTERKTCGSLGLCVLLFLLGARSAKAQDCFIRLYGNMNVDYVEVTVDTRSLGSNEILENVSFDVTLDVKGTERKASFDFTDDGHRVLKSGLVYQRYVAPFPYGIGLHAWIVAGNCQYSRVLSWSGSDTGTVARSDRKPLRKGHPPEPSRVLGKLPPRFWP
jgi:hypothetical protein